MPIPEIKRLEPGSEEAQIKAALSACIAQEIRAGRDREQASAICHDLVAKQTGKGGGSGREDQILD